MSAIVSCGKGSSTSVAPHRQELRRKSERLRPVQPLAGGDPEAVDPKALADHVKERGGILGHGHGLRRLREPDALQTLAACGVERPDLGARALVGPVASL